MSEISFVLKAIATLIVSLKKTPDKGNFYYNMKVFFSPNWCNEAMSLLSTFNVTGQST